MYYIGVYSSSLISLMTQSKFFQESPRNDQKDLSKPLEASNGSNKCAVQTPKPSSAIDLVRLRNYSFKFVVE